MMSEVSDVKDGGGAEEEEDELGKAPVSSSISAVAEIDVGAGMVDVKIDEKEEVDLMREIESFMHGGEDDDEDEEGDVDAVSPVKKLQQVIAQGEEAGEPLHEQGPPSPRSADLSKEHARLVAEKDRELERMEKEAASMKTALSLREEELKQAREESEAKYNRLKEETDAKINEFKKQFTAANRDKEAMVMKFALGEREVLVQRKAREETEKRLKVVLKEKEDMENKVKVALSDKSKAQQVADSRVQEANMLKKEVDRWKEEVKVQEAKACIASSRLKAEMDAHKETRDHLDKTINHLSETRQEIEVTRRECAEFMQKIRTDEEIKQRQVKVAEKEQSAKLIIDAAAATELDGLKERHSRVLEENNGLSQKVEQMEKDQLEKGVEIGKLKEQVVGLKQEVSDLLAQVAEMESLRMRLQQEEETCADRSAELDRLQEDTAELREDMASLRQKEAELLEFTQKLTDKNVTLQSDLASAEARASASEAEHARLAGRTGELEAANSQTTVELEEERKRRKSETELLARKLAEKASQVETLSQQTVDAENEVKVLKRKNAASLRELTRELQACKKALDERQQSHPAATSPSISRSSRASSNTSLNRLEPVQPDRKRSGGGGGTNRLPTQPESNGGVASQSPLVPDSQVLVDKIIKLQRLMARRQEKVDFMEEHIGTLLEEVKKKNRIIQHYAMTRTEPGALATTESDRNKRKISESGGIMASLYTSRLSDSKMTLELSLEINQKLQALLEDTLLKNITLKENINTLGNEIACLQTK